MDEERERRIGENMGKEVVTEREVSRGNKSR